MLFLLGVVGCLQTWDCRSLLGGMRKASYSGWAGEHSKRVFLDRVVAAWLLLVHAA
jgi:hypothetical protein